MQRRNSDFHIRQTFSSTISLSLCSIPIAVRPIPGGNYGSSSHHRCCLFFNVQELLSPLTLAIIHKSHSIAAKFSTTAEAGLAREVCLCILPSASPSNWRKAFARNPSTRFSRSYKASGGTCAVNREGVCRPSQESSCYTGWFGPIGPADPHLLLVLVSMWLIWLN